MTTPAASQPIGFHNSDLPDVIELRDVGHTYDGKNWIIKGCNLLIEDLPDQGQFVVILGQSGCGKSTLLRYIAGLQKPTEGDVLLHGAKPRHDDFGVAMVFQQYSSLPCYTVRENVSLPLVYDGHSWADAGEVSDRMIAAVGLKGQETKYAKYPTLSGGQLQRVAIARSLVTHPDILLMDEPFGALDTRTRLELQLLVYKIWAENHPTIVFVTHDISEAVFLADDIYIMRARPGQIVEHFPGLQMPRTPEVKQSSDFLRRVNEIEQCMMRL